MDVNIRNEIMVNYEYLINAVIRRNRTLLKALRVEAEDAHQELCLAMLKAVEGYNPLRSDSLAAHIVAKLQFAILDMKKRHKPCGMTGTGGTRITFISVNYVYEDGYPAEFPCEDDHSAIDWSDILAALAPQEREAVDMRMEGQYLRRKSQQKW